MSRKRSEAAILRYRRRFIEGAMERGVDREVAERVYGQIEGFSGFGFPKSHSAAFGLLAYQSTWLRVHYGAEFLCALLNEQPMGFYPPDALVHEAQRRGIEVLAPDVNLSELDCRVETVGAAPGGSGSPPVRVGLGYVAEVATDDARAVLAEREHGGPYRDVADLAGRSGASRAALRRLAWAGACDALLSGAPSPGADRRRPALWEAGAAARAGAMDEGTQLALPLDSSPAPALPELAPWERIVADYRATGMKGVVFMLLEDEHGMINLVVPPPVAERSRLVVRTAGFVLASGKLERREGTTNVVLSAIERLQRPEMPPAPVRHIVPPIPRETGRGREEVVAELEASLPAPHSFGRRG
jgi:error-prone DNA polymerase